MALKATLDKLRDWMRARGWQPLEHQEAAWASYQAGEEGLISVPTGMGKTYAAYFGALAALAERPEVGLRVLWLSPLRAMARDIETALRAPVQELALPIEVASRTGDTSSYRKRKLRERLPHVLVTTPESLSLLLSYEDATEKFGAVDLVVVDEWHELLGSKRGTQTELALARLRTLNPVMKTWALSATLNDLPAVAQAVLGPGRPSRIIESGEPPRLELRTILGDDSAYLPWFGFLGGTLFDEVVAALDPERSTLLFTNTRNQAERWFRAIVERKPEWFPRLGVHHGSIDGVERKRVEDGLASGAVTIVICTTSLDLGVDFTPVERVFQIGSPRGVARMLQRAGRSGHRPGAASEICLVPTHAMQLIEFAALRRAIDDGRLEDRHGLDAPVDVLVQHLVTLAAGGGFEAETLFKEVRSTWAYRELDRETFDWVLRFLESGGSALRSYPNYRRLQQEDQSGRYRVKDEQIARRHRMAIGTITGNSSFRVRFRNGRELGHIEESALARLQPGDKFLFAGRALELVFMRGTDVWVKASRAAEHAPKWIGDELPLSEPLADAVVSILAGLRQELLAGSINVERGEEPPELTRARRMLALQAQVARVPGARQILAELCDPSKESQVVSTSGSNGRAAGGSHLFLYPFAGQLANRLLASLLAWRISQRWPVTFALSANEYGLELHAAEPFDFTEALKDPMLFDRSTLHEDALQAVNAAELGRRQFRRVARVAGLIDEGLPSARKSARQLQTSAGLLYDVFAQHEADNLLFLQAQQEALDIHFEPERLHGVLARLSAEGLEIVRTERPSPMSFALTLDRVEARVSSETLRRRVERLKAEWIAATEAAVPSQDERQAAS
ncbi:MAG: ligase-associated DNA damage response DEXH box helicase [Pseudomonadota bacterium]